MFLTSHHFKYTSIYKNRGSITATLPYASMINRRSARDTTLSRKRDSSSSRALSRASKHQTLPPTGAVVAFSLSTPRRNEGVFTLSISILYIYISYTSSTVFFFFFLPLAIFFSPVRSSSRPYDAGSYSLYFPAASRKSLTEMPHLG